MGHIDSTCLKTALVLLSHTLLHCLTFTQLTQDSIFTNVFTVNIADCNAAANYTVWESNEL